MRIAASNQEPLAVRLYRSLLSVYPAEFRREYATEMKLAFQDRWEESGRRAARLWLQTLVDIACSATREHLDQIAADVRFAARTLSKDRSYAFVATSVLALGIAASTIAFTVLNATLLRPLPYPEADRLVAIDQAMPDQSTGLSWPQFGELSRDPGTLTDIGGYAFVTLTLTSDPEPQEVTGSEVTAAMIPLLRVNPIIGRLFTEQEYKRGNDAVILLSHSLWLNRYGGDPAIVGRQIRTISRPYTVVGVMPPSFRFPDTSHFWVPGVPELWSAVKPTTLFIRAFGRVHNGATVEQAQSAIGMIMKRIDKKHDSTSWRVSTHVRPLRTHLTTSFRPAVLASMGAVGLVLLISCANIGSLLLARASTRHRELSLRAALGANRSRIVRQLVVESTALAVLGGSAGLLLVLAVKPAVVGMISARLPLWMNFDWDWRILAFVACASLLTSVMVGLVPALRLSSMNPIEALKEGGKGGSASRGTRNTLNLLAMGQIAMAVLLLLNAGLLARSFLNLLHADVGFDGRDVLTFRGTFLGAISPSGINAVREGALAELSGLPGVRSVAMASQIPLSTLTKRRALTVEGQTVLKLSDAPTVNLIWASPGYFRTLRIPMVSGRDFAWSDGSAKVAVVDTSLANQYWPGQNPIGRRIRMGPPQNNEPWHTVIGVVGDAKISSLTAGQPGTVYIPLTHIQWRSAMFVVKSENDPASLASAVKQRLTSAAGDTAVDQVQRMEVVKDIAVWQPRFFTTLFIAFAAIALVVTAVGLYGVMSYSISQRTHELGVRIALGAPAAGVAGLIVRSAMFLTGIGMVIGLVGAVATGKFIEAQLFGVQTTDEITVATVCGIVTATAAFASFLPAFRATQVDPVVTLRHE